MDKTELVRSGKYYTYGHYLDGNLIYIGEGKRYRAWQFGNRSYKERRKEVEVRIFGIFDSEELAVFNEGLLIYQERMGNNEHLLNKAEFGRGTSGYRYSDETKKKISESQIGKQHSAETKYKMSAARRGRKNPMFGKQHSDETKEKISESLIGKYAGKNHPNFKGLTIGVNKDAQTIVFSGVKDMKSREFSQTHISRVILGKRSHHRGFVFIRINDPVQLRELLNTAEFVDGISKQRIEEFLSK